LRVSEPLRVAAYVHPDRVGAPETGVAKHIRHMVLGLSQRPGIDLSILTARQDWAAGLLRVNPHPFAALPRTELPGGRGWLERTWALLNMPAADRWCPGADWVYCPMETYVPTRRARLAVTAHGMEWFEPDAPWYRSVWRHRLRWQLRFGPVIRNTKVLILAVSEFMKSRLVQLFGVNPHRVEVVGNGVEPVFFAAAEQAPPPQADRPYVIVVGGLHDVKGGDRTLAAADELRRRDSDIEIRIVGLSGSRGGHPEACNHPHIRFLGFIPTEDGLPELMHGAVALLFLSRYESFGIPAAEAMAVGTPVIVSRNGALPEVVGDAGIVTDADNPTEVVDAIEAMATDPQFRADHIRRGRERARTLTWAACVSRLDAILHRSS
jgi:glycosyltransferase involved in cell wall biosynthesis